MSSQADTSLQTLGDMVIGVGLAALSAPIAGLQGWVLVFPRAL